MPNNDVINAFDVRSKRIGKFLSGNEIQLWINKSGNWEEVDVPDLNNIPYDPNTLMASLKNDNPGGLTWCSLSDISHFKLNKKKYSYDELVTSYKQSHI